MRKFAFFAVTISLLTGGCATRENFVNKMNAFIGQPESSIVMTYGVPTATHVLGDGSKILQYTRSKNIILPGATTYQPVVTNTYGNVNVNRGIYGVNSGSYTQTSTTMVPQTGPAINVSQHCTVNFMISAAGTVQNWKSEGNHCVSN